MKKVVGLVTEDEKNEIKAIYRHKNSLEELILSLPKNSEIYNDVISDLDATMDNYQKWWDICYEKYKWEKGEVDWMIIFETNEIVIEID